MLSKLGPDLPQQSHHLPSHLRNMMAQRENMISGGLWLSHPPCPCPCYSHPLSTPPLRVCFSRSFSNGVSSTLIFPLHVLPEPLMSGLAAHELCLLHWSRSSSRPEATSYSLVFAEEGMGLREHFLGSLKKQQLHRNSKVPTCKPAS